MLDFLSSSYLGLRHASADLGQWSTLTTGRPSVLGGAALADLAAREVAALQGQEDGIAAASTLHLAVDLFTGGLPSDATLLWDAHLYPVLRLGLGLARRQAERLPAHDPDVLAGRIAGGGGRPVLITDGYCLDCGRSRPWRPISPYCGHRRHPSSGRYPGPWRVRGHRPWAVRRGRRRHANGPGRGREPVAVTGYVAWAKAFSTPMAVLLAPRDCWTRCAARRPGSIAVHRRYRPLGRRCGHFALMRDVAPTCVGGWPGHCACSAPTAGRMAYRSYRAFHPVQTVMLPVGTHAARLSRAAASQGLTVAACQSETVPHCVSS